MAQLKIIPLGGMGNVTQNLYVYELADELLIVDCGIGFPDHHMPGVDILIPDISYIVKRVEEGATIVGMILSHGHDDHIAATPHVLPKLPDFPIYASPLTAAFATERMKETKANREIQVIRDKQRFTISESFSAEFFAVTHSVPDTKHIAIHTPEGIVYHGTDFKIDPNPIDGVKTDLESIGKFADQNVLCMLMDCLRVEKSERVKSESEVGPAIAQTLLETKGKYVITLMSSHIHRIQQAVDAALEHKRKIVFVGRSVEQNIRNTLDLNMLDIPRDMLVDKRDIDQYRDDQLCIIIAGSQGQEGSSLMRAVFGDHPVISLKPDDKVVFAAHAIPGNELNYYSAIDELSRNGIDVVYPDILPNLHQSGHGSAVEQRELLDLVKPRYVMPIGGQDRHRTLFAKTVAGELGYSDEAILLPKEGEILAFENGSVSVADRIHLKPQLVDGLGIGDVGPRVLSDRMTLGQAGMVVVVMPRANGEFLLKETKVISKGFVFMKDADEVIEFIRQEVANVVNRDVIDKGGYNKSGSGKGRSGKGNGGDGPLSDGALVRRIENRIERKLYKIIRREPLVLPVILDL